MSALADRSPTLEAEGLFGSLRRFGETGPLYEVVGVPPAYPSLERMLRIRVIETGEELDYKLADLLSDPSAA